tara:strand:- start:725 stop:1003 length:279 start_codon:yes stop_codon:yes gene_type:complete
VSRYNLDLTASFGPYWIFQSSASGHFLVKSGSTAVVDYHDRADAKKALEAMRANAQEHAAILVEGPPCEGAYNGCAFVDGYCVYCGEPSENG